MIVDKPHVFNPCAQPSWDEITEQILLHGSHVFMTREGPHYTVIELFPGGNSRILSYGYLN